MVQILLFQGKYEEAKKIYVKFKDKVCPIISKEMYYPPDAIKKFKDYAIC